MRHSKSRLIPIAVVLFVAGGQACADTATLRLENWDAEELAGCFAEVMARVGPELGIADEALRGLSVLPVAERNEVSISGQREAVELAQKVMRALDVPRPTVSMSAQVIRTENPAEILRLPESVSFVQIGDRVLNIPDEALGIERPVPRDLLPTLLCVPEPNLATLADPGAGHRIVSTPRLVTMAGLQGVVRVGADDGSGHEVAFTPSVLPDGSISVVLTLYYKGAGQEQADEIELAYVARDAQPWAFALLQPAGEKAPTTIFVVTVSKTELK